MKHFWETVGAIFLAVAIILLVEWIYISWITKVEMQIEQHLEQKIEGRLKDGQSSYNSSYAVKQ